MSSNAKLIQRNAKIYSWILLAVIIGISVFNLLNVIRLISAGLHSNDSFTVLEKTDNFGSPYYYLSIDDQYFYRITVDNISTSLETGEPNYKLTYMTERCGTLINQQFLIAILFPVYKMLRDITDKETAFTKSNVRRLRIISILTLVLAIYAPLLQALIHFFVFSYAEYPLTFNQLILVLVSIAVWGMAYVMDYGWELQREADETI